MVVQQQRWSRRTVLTSGFASLGLGLSGAGSASGLSRSSAEPMRDKLDEIIRTIEAETRNGRATGISISVAKGGAIVWEGGVGAARKAPEMAATAHTPFCLASITKTFTAAAVMRLVEAGKLDLNAPIDRYLPSPLLRSHFDTQAVTLRLLGGHCAGLPTLFDMFETAQAPATIADLVGSYGELAYPAGERFEYANLGYSLLGAAVSHITGREFSESLNELVIRPIGLRNTFFDTDRSRMRVAAGRFDENGNDIPFYTTITPPSGEVYASAHDLSVFAAHMMGIGAEGRRPLLGREARDALFAPVFTSHTKAFTTFGWSGRDVEGERMIVKTGGQPGVAARLTLLPVRQLSIAVIANRNDSRQLVADITSKIASLIIPDWSNPDYRVDDTPPPNTAPQNYDGSWSGSIRSGNRSEPLSIVINAAGGSQLTMGSGAARSLRDMTNSSYALEFNVAGGLSTIAEKEAAVRQLGFKLVQRGPNLVGRCLDTFNKPGFSSTVPHIVTLSRSS
jgi:CubicO group peptidase (beta-lactamase class C family)